MSKKKKQNKAKKKATAKNRKTILPGTLIIITILVFFPTLSHDFVNWDDQLYVYENYLITDLWGNFGAILTSPVAGNYHPLTVYSLALDYAIGGLNPFQYHLSNLLLHLLNVLLVFRLGFLLCNKNRLAGFIAALFFAIHPMHVEAVAWVSGRKELLYTLFFLLSMGAYWKYLSEKKMQWLWLSLLWMIFSAASKPSAVVLPLVLLLLDYLHKRQLDRRLVLEKLPFFAISLLTGLLTIKAQAAGGALDGLEQFTLGQRILFSSHSLLMYLLKAVVPYNLQSLYDYPVVAEGLPVSYYLAPIFVVALAGLIFYFRKKRMLVFGLAFFVVNLLLVLQLITYGGAIMAERYTYLAYFGLFLIVGWYGAPLLQKKDPFGKIAWGVLLGLGIGFSIIAFQRVQVWQNGETLWTDAILKDPTARNYGARGDYYKDQKEYSRALADYNQAVTLRPDKHANYGDRGTLLFEQQRYPEAIADFQRALAIKPDDAKVHRNMGSALGAQGRYTESLESFNQAIRFNPEFAEAYEDRGSVQIFLQNYQAARQDYEAALRLMEGKRSAKTYNGLGVVCFYQNDFQQAVNYYTQALDLDPNNGQVWFNRSVSYQQLGNLRQALSDAQNARALGFPVEDNYLQSLQN